MKCKCWVGSCLWCCSCHFFSRSFVRRTRWSLMCHMEVRPFRIDNIDPSSLVCCCWLPKLLLSIFFLFLLSSLSSLNGAKDIMICCGCRWSIILSLLPFSSFSAINFQEYLIYCLVNVQFSYMELKLSLLHAIVLSWKSISDSVLVSCLKDGLPTSNVWTLWNKKNIAVSDLFIHTTGNTKILVII